MSNYFKRNRFYSDHLGKNYLNNKSGTFDNEMNHILNGKRPDLDFESPSTPVINNLKLEDVEELESLEILPSEDFENEEIKIASYLSTTNEDFGNNLKNKPTTFINSEFSLTLKTKNYKRMRSKSFNKTNFNLSIYEFLLENKKK